MPVFRYPQTGMNLANPTTSSAVSAPRAEGRLARIMRAGFWSLGGGLGAYALRIGNSLIMTRLLVPEMFGIMALAGIVQVIVFLLSDLGVRQAVIQSSRGTDPDLLNTAWTLSIVRGIGIWLACVVVAFALYVAQRQGWVVGDTVYAAPELPLVIAAVTFASAIGGFRSTKWIIASRNMELRTLTVIELLSQLVGVVVMVAIALQVKTIWSLVIGGLVTQALINLLTSVWIPGMSNRFRWDPASLKELMNFGRWVLLSSACSVFASNGDRLLLGVWVTPAVLGFYVLAMNLNNIVITLAARLFDSIGMPALSEVVRENPSRFPSAYRRLREPFDIACLGSAGLLFAFGQALVDIMYDARYAQSGQIVTVLSFLLIFSRYGISNSAFLALGQPRYLTVISVVRLVSIYVMMPIGYAFYGLEGAVWAIALHPLPSVPFIWWYNSRHGLNDVRYEFFVMGWWLPGYVVGALMANAYAYLSH
jgi:O-antigen/teichoic acid export membrane protein